MNALLRRTPAFLILSCLLGCSLGDDDSNSRYWAADFNCDGYADLVVGSPLHDGAGTDIGAVFIYFGGKNGVSAVPDLAFLGTEDGGQFGAAVAFAGDVNRDGKPDLLVGAPLDDGDGNASEDNIDKGRAFIFFGARNMDTTADLVMTGDEAGARFGTSVARVGDVEGDGDDDWAVGAPFHDADGNTTEDGVDTGRAYLFFGNSSPDGVEDRTYTGVEAGSRFGWKVATAGDINGGGIYDFAVSAPLDDGDVNATDEGTDVGRVFVFYNGNDLDTTADLQYTGDQANGHFGWDVEGVFDVNDDGVHDLVVGAPDHDAAGLDRGRVWLFSGSATPDTALGNALVISGAEDNGRLGAAIGRIGDVNGDGENDFFIGAPDETAATLAGAGNAYLFYGDAAMDATADATFSGAEAGEAFGGSFGTPGNVNRGGRDFVIGASGLDGAGIDRGRAYLYYGGSGIIDTTADATRDGSEDNEQAGVAGE